MACARIKKCHAILDPLQIDHPHGEPGIFPFGQTIQLLRGSCRQKWNANISIEVIPIKVGVLSDTHIPRRGKEIPKAVREGLQGVNLIIHCGDIAAGYVLDELREIAPVEAVYGNMDPVDLKRQLPKTQVVKVGDYTVGVVHGDGRWKTIDNAFNAFPFTHLDCIVFGHSYIPVITKREGILMLNPGSPTDKRTQKQFSFGLLHVGKELEAEMVFFSSKE